MKCCQLFFIGCILFTSKIVCSQQLIMMNHGNTSTSIRSLSAVGKNIIWAAGSNGQVAKSTDGGLSWHWLMVDNYATKDFRAIYAWNEKEAIIMAVGTPALLLKTTDGGLHWKTVFTDSTKGMFLDALFFLNKHEGWVIGDPVLSNHPFMIHTKDEGNHWEIQHTGLPDFELGEAFFASSNSNIFVTNSNKIWMVTGGTASKLYTQQPMCFNLPLLQGKFSQGANSIDCFKNTCLIVGGDFMEDTITTGNAAIVTLEPNLQIKTPIQAPNGYRSCVKHIKGTIWLCCGTSGVDISLDNGLHWKPISHASFHTICIIPNKNIFLAGSNGRIAQVILK
ncbi:MAG: oxidoreductase [Bacteroidota bacterium]|nr:oxidoreductase [Bacteroidota bacterium]